MDKEAHIIQPNPEAIREHSQNVRHHALRIDVDRIHARRQSIAPETNAKSNGTKNDKNLKTEDNKDSKGHDKNKNDKNSRCQKEKEVIKRTTSRGEPWGHPPLPLL